MPEKILSGKISIKEGLVKGLGWKNVTKIEVQCPEGGQVWNMMLDDQH